MISRSISEDYIISTIYLGGGTPSLLKVDYIEFILKTLSHDFCIDKNAEITLEVNPGTVSLRYVKELYKKGVNRLSIGMQSSNPFELRILEREHDYTDVIKVVNWSRQAGFNNINLDLMFGIPGQSLPDWQRNLHLAVGLQPEHLSLYALTIEDQTPLGNWFKRGLVEIPDSDIAADMYEWAFEFLSDNGYEQYEISNWARTNDQGDIMLSRHNLQYWRNLPYLGLGAGAHGYFQHKRIVNVRSPKRYIDRINDKKSEQANTEKAIYLPGFPISPAIMEINYLEKETEMSETMIMGLRLVKFGIDEVCFLNRFGISLENAYGGQIEKLVNLGLLEWVNSHNTIRLTNKGRFLGNRVFVEFVS